MDEFLKAFLDAMHEDAPREQQQTNPSPMELLVATLHHCWEDHPLRVEHNIFLMAITPNLALDLSDISLIKLDEDGDYRIAFKSSRDFSYVTSGTPEFEALKALMHKLIH